MNYQKLLQPMKINSLEIPNRMVVSAMVTNFANADGTATEKLIAYHEEKARGGWGLIITEDYKITKDGGGFRNLPGLFSDELIPSHKILTDRVHKLNGRIVAQIYHAGRETLSEVTGSRIVGPSAIREPSLSEIPRELSIEEIRQLIIEFGDCATRVKQAGFDGVEIHGAHGYLVGAFVSPFSNKRTDEYGGTITRRAKFAVDVVREVRRRVGSDFPILYRMSCEEYVNGGMTIEEAKVLARLLENAGVDCLHCSQGVYSSPTVIIPPAKIRKGRYVDNAAAIKSVVNIPVIAVGRITDPEMADSILASGKADLVTMARASLADPFLPQKVKEGREDEILRCIGCRQGCSARSSASLPVLCMVNPRTGMEDIYVKGQVSNPKKVLVVGGGVSGVMSAVAASRRGHIVTLCEKNTKLGGQWRAAGMPPGKTDFLSFLVWQEGELQRLGVTVRLNTAVTQKVIDEEKPDVIIDATGGVPFIPQVKGIDSDKVILATDVLMGKKEPGKNIAVIGGGMVGMETAEFVAQGGATVKIIEMLPEIGKDAELETRMLIIESLKKLGVEAFTSTKVTEIGGNYVKGECNGKEVIFDKIDTIILAAGFRASIYSKEALGNVPCVTIGDAQKCKDGFHNIQEAYCLGWNI